MRLPNLLVVSSALCIATALVGMSTENSFAQPKPAAAPAAPAPAAGEDDQVEQIALTDKQVENTLAAQKDITAITSKIQGDNPSAKVMAQLDATAKKYGLADYNEYDKVSGTVGVVLAGFDPETKSYVGPEAVIKKQIAEVNADKSMSAKDKKEALDGLNQAAKSTTPVKYPDNIKVVGKYYDKLAEAFQQQD